MDKLKLNYIVDVLMAVSFAITALTGLLMFIYFPSGVSRGGYQEFLGIIKHNWSAIHNLTGISMIFLVLIHLILHFKWLVNMTKIIFKRSNLNRKTI